VGNFIEKEMIKKMLENRMFTELNKVMEEIKKFTPQYVKELGLANGSPTSMISCLSHDHEDRNPSCGWYSTAQLYHCFGCGESFDIFKIASLYEDKPEYGKDFILKNVFYLADKYNVDRSDVNVEFTPEDLEKFKQYDIMRILSEHVTKHINDEYLERRKIERETAVKLKIGSVDWEELQTQLKDKGFTEEDYKKIGVQKFILNKNKLVLIIKDNNGRPVSFVSREMVNTKELLKEKLKEKEIDTELFFSDKAFRKEILETNIDLKRIHETPKYINGKSSLIYNKSEILFGFSDVQNKLIRAKPLIIVEGYLDFVTAYQHKMYNVVALGSASFTDEHINVLENSFYVNKVSFALDEDSTGKERTKSIIERLKNNQNLTVKYSVAESKKPGKDLDEILNTYTDIDDIEEIYEIRSLFKYTIDNLIDENYSDEEIVELVMPSILQENSPFKKHELAKELARYVDSFSHDTILREIYYREDIEKKEIAKKYERVFEKCKSEAIKDPKNASVIMDHLSEEIEKINSDNFEVRRNLFEKTLESLKEHENKIKDENSSIKTGYEVFDQCTLTIPNVISIAGRANSFKTTLFENVAVNIIENNPNAMVFFYTTDDPIGKIFNDFVACITGLPRDYVNNPLKHAEYGLETSHKYAIDMYTVYSKGYEKITRWIKNNRLIIQQATDLPSWNAYENALKELSMDKSLKNIYKVSIIDSVNKIGVNHITDENHRISYLSEQVKKAAEKYEFTIFQNIELKKIPDKYKVSLQDLRGSARLEYDPSIIITGNNNYHNLKGETDLKFIDDNGRICPIITLEIEKTKMGGEKYKKFFYKIFGSVNKMEEIKYGTEEYEIALNLYNEDLKKYMNSTESKL
jgi:DNA primase